MRQPMTITFSGMKADPILESEIRKRAGKLDTQCPGIISCHVVADIPHRHHQKGNNFRVRIDIKVRREEIAVEKDGPHRDHKVVLRQAFDVARRRLQDHVQQRRDVKRRVESPRRGAAKRRRAA